MARLSPSGLRAVVSTLVLAVVAGPALADNTLDLEAALVVPGYNDVGVPGDNGTRFSLTDDLDAATTGAFRIRYGRDIGDRHWLAVLAAPLSVDSQGAFDSDVIFNGTTFPADQPVKARFRFDSYRLIYRYRWRESETFTLSVGGALKIRDAAIRLSSGEQQTEKSNVGVVPLLSFAVNWQLQERLSLLIDGEALAAPQGRAEDVLLAARYAWSDALAFKAGYRLLEGGADNDEVYTFSLFNSVVAGAIWSF